jgi:hypothetical protein
VIKKKRNKADKPLCKNKTKRISRCVQKNKKNKSGFFLHERLSYKQSLPPRLHKRFRRPSAASAAAAASQRPLSLPSASAALSGPCRCRSVCADVQTPSAQAPLSAAHAAAAHSAPPYKPRRRNRRSQRPSSMASADRRRRSAVITAAQSASPYKPRRRRRLACCKHLCNGLLRPGHSHPRRAPRKTIPFLLASRIPFMTCCLRFRLRPCQSPSCPCCRRRRLCSCSTP